jgi:flavin reductase
MIIDIGQAGPEALKSIWRGYAGTVTVIATSLGDQRVAMVVTSVTSVSLEPPALLVCVNKSASAHDALLERRAFTAAILSADNIDLGAHIARASQEERFQRGHWDVVKTEGPLNGLPIIRDAQANLFCEIDRVFEYGTHSLLVSRVAAVLPSQINRPLLYCAGNFGEFTLATR